MKISSTFISAVLGAVAVALFPLLIGKVAFLNNYHLTVLTFIAIFTILTVGLNLLMGYAGQVSLGHAAFFGIGAYTSAVLTTDHGMNPWLAMLIGMILTGVVALLVSIPCLRLSGHYLAMATLGFGWIVYIVMQNWPPLKGNFGIEKIPYLSIGPFTFASDISRFYLAWAFAILVLVITANTVNSRFGRSLRALHVSEKAAATLGVDVAMTKIQVFVISAVFAAVAGSLFAHTVNYICPSNFGFLISVQLVVMVVIGGMASVWGALLGAAFILLMVQGLQELGERNKAFQELDVIVHGAILILAMIFMPSGLTVGIRDLVARAIRRRSKPVEKAPAPREAVTR